MSNEREELLEALDDLEGIRYEYESLLPIAIYLKKHLAKPEQKPLCDFVLSREIDNIKKDADFSNVRPWQIYYLARRIEELHEIGADNE
jgi:hypothetical protein